MKKIGGRALGATIGGVFLCSPAFMGCKKQSSVTGNVETPINIMTFQLDSVPEPPLKKSRFVILTHSRYLFYNLAKEIAAYHDAAIIHINDNSYDQIVDKLKQVQPEYAIVVLPPFLISPDLVGNLFKCFCSLNDDVYPDLKFGYMTGYTVDDARDLFYRDQANAVRIDKFLGVSHIFDGGDWVKPYLGVLVSVFAKSGWNADSAVISNYNISGSVAEEIRKFSTGQLIYFMGHGSYDIICGLRSYDLSNVDLTRDIVVSGACFTGATFSEGAPYDYVALRILKQGACAYESNVIDNGWDAWMPATIATGDFTWGEAVRQGIVNEMDYYKITDLNILPYAALTRDYPAGDYPKIDLTARLVPFGDPSFKPKMKNAGDSIRIQLDQMYPAFFMLR